MKKSIFTTLSVFAIIIAMAVGAVAQTEWKNVGFHCNNGKGNGKVADTGKTTVPLTSTDKGKTWVYTGKAFECPNCDRIDWVAYSNNGKLNGNNVQLQHSATPAYLCYFLGGSTQHRCDECKYCDCEQRRCLEEDDLIIHDCYSGTIVHTCKHELCTGDEEDVELGGCLEVSQSFVWVKYCYTAPTCTAAGKIVFVRMCGDCDCDNVYKVRVKTIPAVRCEVCEECKPAPAPPSAPAKCDSTVVGLEFSGNNFGVIDPIHLEDIDEAGGEYKIIKNGKIVNATFILEVLQPGVLRVTLVDPYSEVNNGQWHINLQSGRTVLLSGTNQDSVRYYYY